MPVHTPEHNLANSDKKKKKKSFLSRVLKRSSLLKKKKKAKFLDRSKIKQFKLGR